MCIDTRRQVAADSQKKKTPSLNANQIQINRNVMISTAGKNTRAFISYIIHIYLCNCDACRVDPLILFLYVSPILIVETSLSGIRIIRDGWHYYAASSEEMIYCDLEMIPVRLFHCESYSDRRFYLRVSAVLNYAVLSN